MTAAPIQNKWEGDEISSDMPNSYEKVSIRRAKMCILLPLFPFLSS